MLPRTHSLVASICIVSFPLPFAIPLAFLSHYVVDIFCYPSSAKDVNIEIIIHLFLLFLAIKFNLFIILGVVLGCGIDILDKLILNKPIFHLNLKRTKLNRRQHFFINLILFFILFLQVNI